MGTVTPELETRARELCDQLTLDEKVRLLSGSVGFYPFVTGRRDKDLHQGTASAADVPRLGLKGLCHRDGPRGVVAKGTTCFPVAMARAATFSPELEERVGDAIGREARALGFNWVLAPCVNLLRHPAWGRAQETYGEHPGLLGDMGAACVRGIQKHSLACVKHFICNSIEDSRLKVDVRVSEETLDMIYLPAFERAVREGVSSVMTAYNSLNGQWCSQNRQLLTDILKGLWGFDGFVVSDWIFGVHDGPAAIAAGLDLEMPSPILLGHRLLRAVRRGKVPLDRVNDAALRLIRQQLRLETLGDGRYGKEVVACEEHRALAREVATRSIVLLRNEPPRLTSGAKAEPATKPVLPLDADRLKRLAVVGRLAAVPNLGDKGSSRMRPTHAITPLEGLRAALEPEGVEVIHDDGSDPARAAEVAAAADAVVVVVGYDHDDEGENLATGFPLWLLRRLPLPPRWGLRTIARKVIKQQFVPQGYAKGGDRKSLTLHAKDEDLLLAVAAVNPRTIATVMSGSAVLMERWRQSVPAILMLWYPGMEGGHALADIVLGREKPTGKLPFTIPISEKHLPPFDPTATAVEYGPLHGQALLDHLGVEPAFPFGFGLTYD